ncbi:hypothetical protein BDQ12DRAFT_145050 [Crucibulum laeve]|uniref:Uncharacterized protein n=1 Tax=Crucibulum laeve TaxID=68775 RepID=A0A5C3LWM8_9AGAR|nr:hypothetical protein BDQ12DRAFT_145050 [Crucibulum laeve]
MLDAFKVKPFDLEPIYASWTDGPQFTGNPKKDPPVDEWLEQIRAGCVARNIPEEYWYKVAQHFMGSKAKARLDELKQVVLKVHGGKYRWTWKKFRIAMQNMGWGIDKSATETIKVQGKPSGLWFMRKKDDKDDKPNVVVQDNAPKKRTLPSRANTSFWPARQASVDTPTEPAPRRQPVRAATESSFWPSHGKSKDSRESSPHRPTHQKAKSDSAVANNSRTTASRAVSKPPTPSRTNTSDSHGHGGEVTTITQAPVWLLNACTALEYITSEHPKTMSIISAILITAGSIPALPAISAGAGGAVLASGAAHAIGAIAVGLGQALSSTVKNSQEHGTQHATTTVH